MGDSAAYINSGITFARTGVISVHNEYPTAMIMPGMPVLIGAVVKITGEEFWTIATVLRVIWYCCNIATAYFAYKASGEIAPKWTGLIAAVAFAMPNRIWSTNIIMTETPYMMFLSMAVYYLLAMGNSDSPKHFAGFVVSLMLGLMFRAVILMLIPAVVLYLLVFKRKSFRIIARRCAVIATAFMLFSVPWTIRNYKLYNAFIPVTYGAGDPKLKGTQQGEDYPSRDNPRLLAEADELFRQKYSEYLDIDGNVINPVCEQYLELERSGILADCINKEWIKNDTVSFLKSYLVIKPRWMLNWTWYWDEFLNIPYSVMHYLSICNMLYCAVCLTVSIAIKKNTGNMVFLATAYVAGLYIHATSFATDRYGACIILFRFILAAAGTPALIELFRKTFKKKTLLLK